MALPQLKAVVHDLPRVAGAVTGALTGAKRTSFQFIGGWHITKDRPELEQRAENLCMMGDIGKPSGGPFQELLSEASEKFRKVFILAGRCEYGGAVARADTDLFLEQMCQNYDNVNYLQRTAVMVRPDLIVAGSTLRLRSFDERYETNLSHLLDELQNKRRTDGRKVLYLSYGAPERGHLKFIKEVTGDRMLIHSDIDSEPPSDIVYM
jgi:hypothetical protein